MTLLGGGMDTTGWVKGRVYSFFAVREGVDG